MNTITAWLKSHSITSHSIVVAWAFLTGLYATQPAFHDFIVKMYTDMPKSVHEIIAGVLIPGLVYYKATKGQTTPPPPTAPSNPATLNAKG